MWGLRDQPQCQSRPRQMFPTHVGIARPSTRDDMDSPDVPYACGDCALWPPASGMSKRCSLRMWGLRDQQSRRYGRCGMFPTHVGIARRLPSPTVSRRNVPYACGDCAPSSPPRPALSACSLRMWGLRVVRGRSDLPPAMFPTHVGIARFIPSKHAWIEHVPYACGDCAANRPHTRKSRPCSLRMWGLRGLGCPAASGCRMFPTHVGIARSLYSLIGHLPHVPYACGDCAHFQHPYVTPAKCSLRMWGLRDVAAQRVPTGPMFPTHVGIARNPFQHGGACQDVPYACGDCASPLGSLEAVWSCSLRMWGLRAPALGQQRPAVMFPTHVGIARRARPCPRWRVYVPYACGDCARCSSSCRPRCNVPYACGDCAEYHGSRHSLHICSLRMWGLRGVRHRKQYRNDMFPTHVGIARL